jgi:hypothetical protein
MPKLMDGLMAMDARNDFNQSQLKPAGTVGDDCLKWIDGICDAIGDAHEKWRMGSNLVAITIAGPNAIGGRIAGIPLEPFILNKMPTKGIGDKALPYSKAVAKGISSAWEGVCESFNVPTAPWYPTFTQVNGPVAAPVPNIPWALEPCLPGVGMLIAPVLKEKMKSALGKQDDVAAELFESIGKAFAKHAVNWVKNQKITNILGTGPTVGWAPPNSPVGMVAGGHTIPGAGFLS